MKAPLCGLSLLLLLAVLFVPLMIIAVILALLKDPD